MSLDIKRDTYNNKRVNPPGIYDNHKHICSQQIHKIHNAKLTELKGEISNSTIIVVDFNSTLSITCRTASQKINKEIKDLNSSTNQLNLTDIYRTLHPTTFFPHVHMKHFPGQIICLAIKQGSINLKGLKSYEVCSSTKME